MTTLALSPEVALSTRKRLSSEVLSHPLTLLQAQLHAIDTWQATLAQARAAVVAPGMTREARLDASRRLEVRLREQQALIARTEREPGDSPMRTSLPTRAVIAHRHAWTRDTLAEQLGAAGMHVLMTCDNGADAVGVSVAEQPHLLVVDALLAMRSGVEVCAESVRLYPHTLVAGYVNDSGAVGPLLDAGACTVFTRRVPPAEAVQNLLALL
jgi:CheY-like chemotaxis protein